MKTSVVIIVVRSSSERWRVAEMIPVGIATAIQTMTAPRTSRPVAGRSEKITSLTSALDW